MESPLRRKKKITVIRDPKTGEDRVVKSLEEKNVFLDGSLDSTEVEVLVPLKCGCINKEIAGTCFQCGNVVCADHIYFCADPCCCQPLCSEHVYFVDSEKNGKLPMCKFHFKAHRRKTSNRKIRNFLLAPFFEFED